MDEQNAILEWLPALSPTVDSAIEGYVALAEVFLPRARRLAEATGAPWPSDYEKASVSFFERSIGVRLRLRARLGGIRLIRSRRLGPPSTPDPRRHLGARIALHGLACEQCRTEELCVTDVVPKVVPVLENDPNPEVRFKAIPILRRLSSRDPAVLAAIIRAAEADADERVRLAAAAILRGERPRRWNQFRRTAASRRAKASRRHKPSDWS